MESLKIKQNTKNDFVLLNVESPTPFDSVLSGINNAYRRFRLQSDGMNLWDMMDTLNTKRLIYVWSNVLEIPEIQDIILMHFPVIKQHTFGERYKIIEFAKDTSNEIRIRPPVYLNNFETAAPQWSINGIILDSTRFYSGRFSECLSMEREFSSTFRYTLDHVPAGGIKVFAAVQFLYDGNQPINLVITVSRKGETIYYHAIDLSQFHTNKSGWNIGFASQQWLRSSLRKGDEIVVYCWNNGKNRSVYLDDFLVKME